MPMHRETIKCKGQYILYPSQCNDALKYMLLHGLLNSIQSASRVNKSEKNWLHFSPNNVFKN